MRGKNGHLVGISEETPRIVLTGPLVPGKLDVFEAFIYDLHKQPVRGLAWPKNETKKEGIDSFTSLQYIIPHCTCSQGTSRYSHNAVSLRTSTR